MCRARGQGRHPKSGIPPGSSRAVLTSSTIHASILERTGERTHFREGRACLEELYAVLSHHLLERQVILAAVLFAAEADLAEEDLYLAWLKAAV